MDELKEELKFENLKNVFEDVLEINEKNPEEYENFKGKPPGPGGCSACNTWP